MSFFRVKKAQLLIAPAILLALFVGWAIAAPSPDAIGIRVVPNPKHFSALRWYQDQGFKGSPQSLTVDGYRAIRDGRTVYIDASNVVEAAPANSRLTVGDSLYTNIFIISYNQDAEKETEDIFGRILSHWKFNNNIDSIGICRGDSGTSRTCGDSVGCWPLSSNYNDSRNNGLNGAGSNVTFVDGGVKFNGTNSQVNFGNRPEFEVTDKFSIVANIYPTGAGTPSSGGIIVNREGEYEIARFADGTIRWAIGSPGANGTTTTWYWRNTGYVAPLNQWTNVILTYGGQSVIVYANGEVVQKYDFTGSNLVADVHQAMDDLRIGARDPGIVQYFDGIISGVRLYKRTLSQQEVASSASNSCSIDSDCSENSYCSSAKGALSRDTVRLADLNDLNERLAAYKAANGGLCPKLEAGSYLPNKSVSTWPSWQETLGKALGTSLPFDPINQMGACAGFNAQTCWNEATRAFADPTPADADFNLPDGSRAYVYLSSPNGQQCSFYVNTESGLTCNSAGQCTIGVNLGAPAPFATASNPGAATNTPPNIVNINMPTAIRFAPYQGFIQAEDSDDDNLTWTLTTIGDWSSWVAPTLQVSPANEYQRKLVSSKSGNLGNYSFEVKVDDGHGGIATSSGIVRVGNYCDDQDGDGYGACPNCGKSKGCINDGNDCDDTPGPHLFNGTFGPVNINGNQINPNQNDDCTQYDGIDNDCDGLVDNHATTSIVIGTSVQDMETVDPLSGWPIGWSGSGQASSFTGVSAAQNRTPGGSKSVLLHQDANRFYGGVCTQAICTDPNFAANRGCRWDPAGGGHCYFPNGDGCHDSSVKGNYLGVDYKADYDNGQSICWGNTNTVMWGYMAYDLSTFPFNVGDTYILQYYYKGVNNFQNSNYYSLSFSPGWQSYCYGQGGLAYNPCNTYYVPYSGYRTLPGDPGNCSDYNLGGVINWPLANSCICLPLKNSLANQTDCFPSISGAGISDGTYNDWTYKSSSFFYSNALNNVKNVLGNRQLIFGMAFGYNDTGPGSDVYIDDLSLLKCNNN